MADKEVKEETFEDVFEQAAGEVDGKEKEKDEKTETTDTDVVAKPKEGDEKGKKVEKEEEKPTYEELDQKYKSLQGMFESQAKDIEELKKPKEEEPLNKEEEKPKIEPKPEEEDKELVEYQKEYDYVTRNEAKLRKKELETLKKEIIEEVSKIYDVPVKTVQKLMEDKVNTEAAEHLGSVMEAHEDYGVAFKKRDVAEWIETLPSTKKKVYKEIFENGETVEVIDLLTEYKEVKGITKKEEKSGDDELTDEEKDEKEKKEKENKRLHEMESVKGKHSPVGGSTKKAEDFDSAFDEATKEKIN